MALQKSHSHRTTACQSVNGIVTISGPLFVSPVPRAEILAMYDIAGHTAASTGTHAVQGPLQRVDLAGRRFRAYISTRCMQAEHPILPGFPVGEKVGDDYVIYNHLTFSVFLRELPEASPPTEHGTSIRLRAPQWPVPVRPSLPPPGSPCMLL